MVPTPAAPAHHASEKEKSRNAWLDCLRDCREIANEDLMALAGLEDGLRDAKQRLFQREAAMFKSLVKDGPEKITEHVLGILRAAGAGTEFLLSLRNNALGSVAEAMASIGAKEVPARPDPKTAKGRGFAPLERSGSRQNDADRYRTIHGAWTGIFRELQRTYIDRRREALAAFSDQADILEANVRAIRNPQDAAGVSRMILMRIAGHSADAVETAKFSLRIRDEAARLLDARDLPTTRPEQAWSVVARMAEIPGRKGKAKPYFGLPEDLSAQMTKRVTETMAALAMPKPDENGAKTAETGGAPSQTQTEKPGSSTYAAVMAAEARLATMERCLEAARASEREAKARERAALAAANATGEGAAAAALAKLILEHDNALKGLEEARKEKERIAAQAAAMEDELIAEVPRSSRRKAKHVQAAKNKAKSRSQRLVEKARAEWIKVQQVQDALAKAETENASSKRVQDIKDRLETAMRNQANADLELRRHQEREAALMEEIKKAKAALTDANGTITALSREKTLSEAKSALLLDAQNAKKEAEDKLRHIQEEAQAVEKAEGAGAPNKDLVAAEELVAELEAKLSAKTSWANEIALEREHLADRLAQATEDLAMAAAREKDLAAGFDPQTERRFRIGLERRGFADAQTDDLVRYLVTHPEGGAARQRVSELFDEYVNQVRLAEGKGKNSSTQGKTESSSGNFANNLYMPVLESLSKKDPRGLMSVDLLEEIEKHQDRKGQNKAFLMSIKPYGHVRGGVIGSLRMLIQHMRHFKTADKTSLETLCNNLQGHLVEQDTMRNFHGALTELCESLADNHPSAA